MYIWLIFIVFLLVLKLLMGDLSVPQKRKKYLAIVGAATVFLMALRGENYGEVYDIHVYKEFLEKMGRTQWDKVLLCEDFETGFCILNKLLSYIMPFGQGILIFHAFFCIYAVCRFIYRNTEEVFWAYFFFVTLGTMGFMMTGLRQAIAMGICLLSVESIKEKKLVKFLIYMIVAFSIHRTAAVFIVAYFVCNITALKNKPWLYLLVGVGISIFAPQIIDIGESLYEDFSASDTAMFGFNGIVPILIYIAAVILNLIYKSKNVNNANNLALTAMGAGFYLFRFYSMILERISFYYTPASTVLLADFIGTSKKDKYAEIIQTVVIILCVMLFIRRLDTAAWAEYVFMWE